MNKAKENKKPNVKNDKVHEKEKEKPRSKSKDRNTNKDEKKDKKLKEKDDKNNGIKKPVSAYILFGKDERPKIIEANPDLKQKDIMSKIGEAWGKLNDAEKKKYNDLAAKEKVNYEKECAEKGIELKGKKKKGSKTEKQKKSKKAESDSESD